MVELATILGAAASLITIALNAFLDLIKRFGFLGYWLVICGILYADMNNLIPIVNLFNFTDIAGSGNVFGSVISIFTIFFGLQLTTTMLFVIAICGGLIWFMWKAKAGLMLQSGG